MNAEKTQTMAVGTPARQLNDGVIGTVDLGLVKLATSHSVRSLGLIVDDILSSNEQVNSQLPSSAFEIISEDTAKTIACSVNDGPLDYCNALLCGTSADNTFIQRVPNSITRAVTNSRRTEHNIKHVLVTLHWLPVEYKVQYKLAVTIRLKC